MFHQINTLSKDLADGTFPCGRDIGISPQFVVYILSAQTIPCLSKVPLPEYFTIEKNICNGQALTIIYSTANISCGRDKFLDRSRQYKCKCILFYYKRVNLEKIVCIHVKGCQHKCASSISLPLDKIQKNRRSLKKILRTGQKNGPFFQLNILDHRC